MKKILISMLALIASTLAFAQHRDSSIQFMRYYDKSGINIFETSKDDSSEFDGIKVRIGGNFTQQFQSLNHSNTAVPVWQIKSATDSVNINELAKIGSGFNLATANLNLDVQLADGIRINIIAYLSSRRHPETWMKGGFVQIDKMTFLKSKAIDNIMKYVTIRVGHMEINYGDAHFRRTDNGNAFYNPFVGNYIMDAFTTEIGSEIYFQAKGFIAMAAITNGEINGTVINPDKRSPSFYGKIGYDNQLTEKLRIRLTSSVYTTEKSANNTLYGGDRAGSRYYSVMENTLSSISANATSGLFNPGFRDKVTDVVINPFIKIYGLELFGNIEQAKGRSATETEERTWNQIGADAVYRFGKSENFYIAGRYNQVNGKLAGTLEKVSIERIQAGLGVFITKNILTKVEYVQQEYKGFPDKNILNGGKFSGVMVEGSIAF